MTATITEAMALYADKTLISDAVEASWGSYSSELGVGVIAGGDTICDPRCTLCGAPADQGIDWCDWCEDDYRLAGDDPA